MVAAVAPSRASPWARVATLAVVVVALDQITKQIVTASIDRGDAHQIIFGIDLANVRNKGVAFGLLADGDVPVLILTLAAVVLVLLYFGSHADRPHLWIAVGLLTGGAAGNLVDRLRIGSVVDFIDPPVWPAFNLADVAIVAGVALLVLSLSAPQHAGDAPPG
jgi:signal peptidase II